MSSCWAVATLAFDEQAVIEPRRMPLELTGGVRDDA
jgi:hypothetical protein